MTTGTDHRTDTTEIKKNPQLARVNKQVIKEVETNSLTMFSDFEESPDQVQTPKAGNCDFK
jgi:hypothetical protein